jgi:hypothetical protein
MIDLAGSEHYHLDMDELFPIEIRIRKLVADFFANKITGNDFKLELARMREEFEPGQKKPRKAGRRRLASSISVSRAESCHAAHPHP